MLHSTYAEINIVCRASRVACDMLLCCLRRFSLDPLPMRVQKVHKFVRIHLFTGGEEDDFVKATHTVQKLPEK